MDVDWAYVGPRGRSKWEELLAGLCEANIFDGGLYRSEACRLTFSVIHVQFPQWEQLELDHRMPGTLLGDPSIHQVSWS